MEETTGICHDLEWIQIQQLKLDAKLHIDSPSKTTSGYQRLLALSNIYGYCLIGSNNGIFYLFTIRNYLCKNQTCL